MVTVLGGQVGSFDRKAHSRIHHLIPDAFVKQDGQWVPFSVPEVHIFEADSIWRSEACQYTVLDSGILDPDKENELWDSLLRWSPYEIPPEALAFALRSGHAVNPGGRYPISHSSSLRVTEENGVQIKPAH